MKILCKTIAGSKMYGLDTPESDTDWRGCGINTELKFILGLERHDHETRQNQTEDSFFYELRHFLNNLRKSTTGALELLWNDNWIEITDKFKEIQKHKEKLIGTEKLYKCLTGYLFGEKKLMLGIRTGALGGKRKNFLDQYGYSPKNLVNALRLCWSGAYFFRYQIYPVNISKYDSFFAAQLMNIKLHPEHYNKEDVGSLVDVWETELKTTFDNRDKTKDFKFDEEYANFVLLEIYGPLIIDMYNNRNSQK